MAAGRRWAIAVLMVVAGVGPVAGGVDAAESDGLKVVGRHDLGGGGGHVAVFAVGSTAVVVSDNGRECGGAAATVVDLRKPRKPRVAAVSRLPFAGVVVGASDEGDVVAIAESSDCGTAGGAVAYYRVDGPEGFRPVGTTNGAGGAKAVAVAVLPNGKVVSAAVRAATGVVEIQDVTDPARPDLLGQWSPPAPAGAVSPPAPAGAVSPPAQAGGSPSCVAGVARADVAFHSRGNWLAVLLEDGHVYNLDGGTPPRVRLAADRPPPPGHGGASRLTVLLLADRSVALVSEACAGGSPALRIVDLDAVGAGAPELVRSPSAAAPGAIVASGDYAFVPWHEDGLRVIDLGGPHPQTLATFTPGGGDIVGTALLANEILALDRNAGLYVLARPKEGGGGESIWDRAKLFLAGLALGGMALLVVVPRLVVARSYARRGAGAARPAAVPQRVRRGGGWSPRRRR